MSPLSINIFLRSLRLSFSLALALFLTGTALAASGSKPLAKESLVFQEKDGLVAVEAEHFFKQTLTDKRAWYLTSSQSSPEVKPDHDPAHLAGASGGAYLEVLPDTRRTHADPLVAGESFAGEAGRMVVLHYRVHFQTPGRYYVWARAYSTGSEDNGLHVGLNGQWPASGQRLQWCQGKNSWRWESRQRTAAQHCGEPHKIFLDIESAGVHTITFSMREDGFEFDKWLLTTDRNFKRPTDVGPATLVQAGELPQAFTYIKPKPAPPERPRGKSGSGQGKISGELKQWHKVTLDLEGPFAYEDDKRPNPFTDYRMSVRFTHESGEPSYNVPGYFAADGNAAQTSATSGTVWRAHLSPDKPGRWDYQVSFTSGKNIAVSVAEQGNPLAPFDGAKGQFTVATSDKTGNDFRSKGRLQYVGQRYLRFAGSGDYFLKAGPDAPETLLAYVDFDNTTALKKGVRVKTWQSHTKDWRSGDPTWKKDKGKALIGALNYLATKGCRSFSFIPYNVGGDGDNV